MTSEYAMIDKTRSAPLSDQQWWAVVCVNPDGTESLWLVSPDLDQPPGCACGTCAPHDQLPTATAPAPHRGVSA